MATTPPCPPLSQTPHGKAPVVLDEFGCLTQLIMLKEEDYPSIEQAISDAKVELRNGSSKYPIELPHLQKQVGGSFTKMMIQDSSGKWFVFTPQAGCVTQRLVVTNGSFMFVDDVLPTLIESEIYTMSEFDDYDYLVAAKLVTETCSSGGSKSYLKWFLVPKPVTLP